MINKSIEINLDLIDELLYKNKEYLIDYKKELNEEQYKAANTREGNYLCVAGAGTGKTRMLTYRVAKLIEDGVDPENILLLTFTKKAAKEMMERAALLLDDRCKQVNGGTYHGFCATLLRKYGKIIGLNNNYSILDNEDVKSIISVVVDELGFKKKDKTFPKSDTLLNIFSLSINKNISIQSLINSEYKELIDYYLEIQQVYNKFMNFKLEKGLVDYDDLILKVCEMLEANKDLATYLSNKYKYIMVDEYQDSNLLQLRLLKLLSVNSNLLVVGDPMQSIYRFRGGYFKNIMNFVNDFPNVEVIKLNKNYRCSQSILDLSNNIMENATEKIYNPLVSNKVTSNKPILLTAADDSKQSKFIVQEIIKLKNNGVSLNDICILVRNAHITNNLEIILNTMQIPYVKVGGIKFLEKKHIKDILALFKIFNNIKDEIAWIRVMKLFKGIGGKTACKLSSSISENNNCEILISDKYQKAKYGNSLKSLYDLYTSNTNIKFSKLINSILDFYTPIAKNIYEDFNYRKADIKVLKEIALNYESVEDFLTELMLDGTDTIEENNKAELLTISTIHGSKGLEWGNVFVMQAIDGVLPSSKSLDTIEELEEERRLTYVAFTRAKDNLIVTAPKGFNQFGNFSECEVSRFLEEDNNIDRFMIHWNIK